MILTKDKIISVLLAALLCLLAGCGAAPSSEAVAVEAAPQPTVEQAAEPVAEPTPPPEEEEAPSDETNGLRSLDSQDGMQLYRIDSELHQYEDKADNGVPYMTCSYEALSCTEEGAGLLDDALELFNQAEEQKMQTLRQELNAEAKELYTNQELGYFFEDTPYLQRADSEYVSFYVENYSYLGGAHPNTDFSGFTIAPSDGRFVSLDEVITSREALYDFCVEDLKRQQNENNIYLEEGFELTLHQLLCEEEKEPCWVLLRDSMVLRFPCYTFGPYAAGSWSVTVPFAEESVFPAAAVQAQELGTIEVKRLEPLYDDNWNVNMTGCELAPGLWMLLKEEGQRILTFRSRPDGEMLGAPFVLSGFPKEGHLLALLDGRRYLYLSLYQDDVYQCTEVFDLNAEPIRDCGSTPLDMSGYSYASPEDMILLSECRVGGRWPVYAHYTVGENGLPVPLEGYYRLWKQEGQDALGRMTVKAALTASRNGEPAEIPEGTILAFVGTDDQSYFDVEDAAGQSYRVDVVLDADGQQTIGGVPLADCLE